MIANEKRKYVEIDLAHVVLENSRKTFPKCVYLLPTYYVLLNDRIIIINNNSHNEDKNNNYS